MKTIKRSLGTGISMLLLLLFSVTIVPLDFLHNHPPVAEQCSDKQTPCEHTVHITKEPSYCWVCAIHFEKTFTSSKTSESRLFLPAARLFLDNAITGYVAEILYTALRGPPSE